MKRYGMNMQPSISTGRMLLIFTVFFWKLMPAAPAAEEKITGEEKKTCLALYKKFEGKLKEASEFYSEKTAGRDTPIGVGIPRRPGEPPSYRVSGDYLLHLWADNGIRFRYLLNVPLYESLNAAKSGSKTPFSYITPALTVTKAVAKARNYLDAFEIDISSENVTLSTVEFDGGDYFNDDCYDFCWEIRWTRVTDGYPWDDFSEYSIESIIVVFHEKHGLYLIGNDIFSTPPESTTVELKRGEAILRASDYAPLVQKTPFYRRAHLGKAVISAVASCELKVAAPNWLFDHERAPGIRDGPPAETRLCWVVEFETRPARKMQRGLKGSVSIYLDAKTGDVVGANFTRFFTPE